MTTTKRISKQKFYEEAILKTYEYCIGNGVSDEVKALGHVPDTFSELMIMRTLHGFPDIIPTKHVFDSLGFNYLKQLIGMAIHIKDDEFTNHLFSFMKTHKKLFDFTSQECFDDIYYFFYESLTGEYHYQDFNRSMGDFILMNFDKKLDGFDKVVSLAYGLGCCNEVGLKELIELKMGVK